LKKRTNLVRFSKKRTKFKSALFESALFESALIWFE
jgi:hypothetical protein